jgi:two-component system sensor histidine kinase DesK
MWLVRVTSWLLLAFLSLLAFGSLVTMNDPAFTSQRRVAGTLVTTLVAMSFVVLQWQLLRNWHNRSTRALSWIVVVLGLTLVPLSNTWSLLGLSIATAMLVAPRRASLALGMAVWGVGAVEVAVDSTTWVTRIGIPLTALLTAVLQVTLTRLAMALIEAHVSREQLARLRVDSERHRISRDLHDIIGRTLVAASLRNEAAQQLLDRDLERAREQLVQVHETIARGQAQLRRLTSGPVIADLSDELNSAQALCVRLGISCDIEAVPVEDPQTAMLAARIVREAVTNMLRHSNPRHCVVALGRQDGAVTVSVTNDGAVPTTCTRIAGSRPAGTGTTDLRARVESSGGAFEAGWLKDERYRVWARLPGSATAPEAS